MVIIGPSSTCPPSRMHLTLLLVACCACIGLTTGQHGNNVVDYEALPGHGFYRYSRTKKSWEDARLQCQNEGAYLAVIDSLGEAQAVRNFYNRKRGSQDGISTYIGFHDKDQEGVYMTLKGTRLDKSGYNTWKYPPTGSRSNQANDCGGMFSCGRYTEMSCSIPSTFICELKEEEVDAV